MSEPEQENGSPDGHEAAGEATEGAGAQRAVAPHEPSPEEKIAQAQAETARVRDQLLRTAADFENFRKRTRREGEEALRRGREGLLKDLLPVFDNLERAAAHADAAPDVKSVGEGLRIVLKQFVDTLERLGIKRIQAVGVPFDPSVHEAIQQIESTEHPVGVVLAEVQPGYMLGDYLIRAAMVVVSKGPPAGTSSPDTN